ncbi:MAG: hypothetical protein ABGZ24_20270, partial [Fuerstiella sp.]
EMRRLKRGRMGTDWKDLVGSGILFRNRRQEKRTQENQTPERPWEINSNNGMVHINVPVKR